MAFNAVLLCASALLVQTISGQTLRGCGCSLGSSIGSNSLVNSNSLINSNSLASGGDFPVTSIGLIVPTGMAVVSDVDLAGNMDICGTMPYVSAVQFQAEVPTYGSGNVDYSCGSGTVGINTVSGSGAQTGLGGSLTNLGSSCIC